ncbi:MAG: PAS domain S-box protein [Porticoccaceae bacterium]|nr:PAS domain S-box protein [Porticoccaceae bacterium]
MNKPELPDNEEARLRILRGLNLLDTPAEERFDRLTRLTKRTFDVPIVAVSLLDENRQWFKSNIGLPVDETSRDISFCGHTILKNEVLVIPDAKKDQRFADNPLVLGEPNIRFYAGYPLKSLDSTRFGTLCVIDTKPRTFDEVDIATLEDLAALVEKEILSSYQRQTMALSGVHDGLVVASLEGIIEEVNDTMRTIFGYTREELVGQHIKSLMPESYYADSDSYLKHRATNETFTSGKQHTLKGKRKDGSIIPVTLQVTQGEVGGARFYTGIIQDLSENFAHKQRLARQDALINVAIHGSSAGFAMVDRSTRFVELNKVFAEWLGYTREEMLGMPIADLASTNDEKSIVNKVSENMFDGKMDSISVERQFKHKNGHLLWGLMSSSVVKDENNNIEFVAATIIDIHQKKKLAYKLKDARDFHDLITEKNQNMIFVKDEQLQIIYANKAFLNGYKVFGRDRKDFGNIIDQKAMAATFPEEEQSFLETDRQAFSEGSAERVHTLTPANGKTHVLNIKKTRFKNSNGKAFILGVCDDLTEQHLLIEELKKSNEDLDQFAYIASHDLKSPLNSIEKIAGWIDADCRDILPEESRKHLALLRSRTGRMSKLLNDLLLYSRVGHYDYPEELVDLKPMVEDIFLLLGPPEGFTCNVTDIRMKLRRIPAEIVLRNLISNAIKHHDKDHGVIDVGYESTDKAHIIYVQDDGPGIPKELHKKALEMFETLRSRDHVEGSGIGLAMVKKIIERYGGTLEIESGGERGTRIVMKAPKRVSVP